MKGVLPKWALNVFLHPRAWSVNITGVLLVWKENKASMALTNCFYMFARGSGQLIIFNQLFTGVGCTLRLWSCLSMPEKDLECPNVTCMKWRMSKITRMLLWLFLPTILCTVVDVHMLPCVARIYTKQREHKHLKAHLTDDSRFKYKYFIFVLLRKVNKYRRKV